MRDSPIKLRHVKKGQPVSAREFNTLGIGVRNIYRGISSNAIVDSGGVYERDNRGLSFLDSPWPNVMASPIIYTNAGGDVTATLSTSAKDRWHTINSENPDPAEITVILTLPSSPTDRDMFFFYAYEQSLDDPKGLFIKPNTGQTILTVNETVTPSQKAKPWGVTTPVVLKYFESVWYELIMVTDLIIS